jgi:hypothetical protein
LIQKWLKAGVLEGGVVTPTRCSTNRTNSPLLTESKKALRQRRE